MYYPAKNFKFLLARSRAREAIAQSKELAQSRVPTSTAEHSEHIEKYAKSNRRYE